MGNINSTVNMNGEGCHCEQVKKIRDELEKWINEQKQIQTKADFTNLPPRPNESFHSSLDLEVLDEDLTIELKASTLESQRQMKLDLMGKKEEFMDNYYGMWIDGEEDS